jgi:RNA polymerase subunit RPABC4/transcription elongation factor Spt4
VDRFGVVLICSYIASVLAVCVGGLIAYARNLRWIVLTMATIHVMLGVLALSFKMLVFHDGFVEGLMSALVAIPVFLAIGLYLLAATIPKHPVRMRACVKCGYDLRGQETPRCPECSTPIEENQWRWLLAKRDAEYKTLQKD